ncbi:MAG: D-TA family PLP-dependent enzyme [Chitinophagaceae bacterium]|nr:D-TA family PLP-dependent enzyme [Chitinophagaceae bacterium]
MEWYTIKDIDQLDTPALVVYPKRVKENIKKAIELAGDPQLLRPHVKTNKMAEVCELMLKAGITHFKCATIAEAEMLGTIKAPEVLLAHQPVGPKVQRLLQLVEQFPQTKFSCIIDNKMTASELSALFAAKKKVLDVFIDLNIGMNRSGIAPEKGAGLLRACQYLPGIQVVGLHGYDGHIRETDLSARTLLSDEAFSKVEKLLAEINENSPEPLQIVAGGSPSFPTHVKRANVQFSPGTFVFWDWGYKHQFPDQPFDYAALVITRIISIIDEKTVCVDLGHKSVAAENPLPRVHFLNAPDAEPVSQSEEHLVVKVADASVWNPGDVWYGVPVHICPTVALYDAAIVVEDHKVVDHWKVVARTRKISI